MAISVNPELLKDIRKYGAFDINACFNCGNCTAVCPLSKDEESFPRKLIRYGQLGIKEKLLQNKDIWLCYYCGECSETCPRQAEPGEYMASLRRYAIANYEPTGITKLLYKYKAFNIFFTVFLAVILGFFMLTVKTEHSLSRWLFKVVPYDIIHNLGLIVMLIMSITIIFGLISIIKNYFKGKAYSIDYNDSSTGINNTNKTLNKVIDSIKAVASELLIMKRHRDCDKESSTSWYLKPWFIHWTIMWGFIGLGLATAINYLFKDPNLEPGIALWYPARIIGTICGLFMMYGTTVAIIKRIKKKEQRYSNTKYSDWQFLIFLFLLGITGYWLEIAIFVHADELINHIVFLIHSIMAMELVLLLIFTKFAHVIYRPIALFLYHYKYSKK